MAPIQAVRRLGWGVSDQGISSLSNFALGLFVARSFGASNFGAFTLAYITYTFVINAARGLATDPLLVRYSGDVGRRWRRATSAATGTALLVGAAAGVICFLAGLLLPDPLGPVFMALGIGLPGSHPSGQLPVRFLRDRARGCPHSSTICSGPCCWFRLSSCCTAAGTGAPLAVCSSSGVPLRWLLCWAPYRRGSCHARSGLWWLRSHRQTISSLSHREPQISGAVRLRSFVLGAVAGLAAVGYVRASEILMGPFLVVLMGLSQVAVPEASRVFHRNSGRLARFCFVLGGSQAAAAIVWGVLIMTIFPLGPGPALLKELWMPTSQLIPAITVTVAAASFTTAATAGLRAMGVARRSLRAQLTGSTAYVVCGPIGAILGGAVGASWGVTVAQVFAALVWWHQLRSALADHHAVAEVAR